MDRYQNRPVEAGDIIQQGPELTDSPKSERSCSGDVRRSSRELYTDNRSVGNSPGLLKKGTGDDHSSIGSDSENVFASEEGNFGHHSSLGNRIAGHHYPSAHPMSHVDQRCHCGNAMDHQGHAPASFLHPSGGSYVYHHQPPVYSAAPAYYYPLASHALPTHPYLIAATQAGPQQGQWIYAPTIMTPPTAVFTPPSSVSSPVRRNVVPLTTRGNISQQPCHEEGVSSPDDPYESEEISGFKRADQQTSGVRHADQQISGFRNSDQPISEFRRTDQQISGFRNSDQQASGYHRPDQENGRRRYSTDHDGNSATREPVSEDETQRSSPYSGATNRYHTGAKLEKAHGRTPLFGESPMWWGQEEHGKTMEGGYESDNPAGPRQSLSARACIEEPGSDTEATRRTRYQHENRPLQVASSDGGGSGRGIAYFVSDRDTEELEQQKEEQNEKVKQPKEATAFTIEFTDEGASTKITALERAQAAEQNWKQQSAGRIHNNFVRRSMRKSDDAKVDLPGRGQSGRSQIEKPPSPHNAKAYLLQKMLSSTRSPSNEQVDQVGTTNRPSKNEPLSKRDSLVVPLTIEGHRIESGGRARESDACSEAGTYVLDPDEEETTLERVKFRQICIDDNEWDVEEDNEDVDSLPTPEPVITPRYRTQLQNRQRDEPKVTPTAQRSPKVDDERQRKHLLKQLIKVAGEKDEAHSPVTTTNLIVHESVRSSDASSGLKLPRTAPSSSTRCANTHQNTAKSAVASKRSSLGYSSTRPDTVKLHRTEPSRQSARSSSMSAASRLHNSSSSSIRATPSAACAAKLAPKSTVVPNPKESATMKNWLRRKEYNPMKAAAEAKRQKAPGPEVEAQSRNEEPAYLSNRSRSFHLGAIVPELTIAGSSGGLKKHPSVNDTSAGTIGDDYGTYLNVEEERAVVSESAALDETSMKRLACLSEELGQRAKRVLSKVQKNSNSATDLSSWSNAMKTKEAALADMLNQLRVASRALEEVDRILPDDQQDDDEWNRDEANTDPAPNQRPKKATKFKPVSPTFDAFEV